MGILDGKTAIVTGAVGSIGRACAEGLIAEGATVVVSDLDAAAIEKAAEEIGAARAIACDVRDDAQMAAFVEGVVEIGGGLDIAVANAGVVNVAPVVENSLEDWRSVTSVNLDGVFVTLKHAALAMVASGGGSIVAISSITGKAGYPFAASYAAAKAGVISLCRTAALELREPGVRVNAVCPGFIETPMVGANKDRFAELSGLDLDELLEQAQGGYGKPADVAGLVTFLASERASLCSGGTYTVDNGLTASLL